MRSDRVFGDPRPSTASVPAHGSRSTTLTLAASAPAKAPGAADAAAHPFGCQAEIGGQLARVAERRLPARPRSYIASCLMPPSGSVRRDSTDSSDLLADPPNGGGQNQRSGTYIT